MISYDKPTVVIFKTVTMQYDNDNENAEKHNNLYLEVK
jgi:hypothetical protein